MEDTEMRLFLRRGGSSPLPLALLVVVAAVAACGGAASAPLSPVGGGAAPAASGAPAGNPDGFGSGAGRPSTGGGGDAGGGGGGTGGGGNQVADLGAKIIRTGSLQVTVADVDTAIRAARDAIRGFGGYVGASEEQRGDDQLVATITYRIPAERWDDALDGIRKLGTVVGEKTDANEVTSQLVDLDARIRNLKASETALVGYAANAPKVSDLLEIESRLTDTRGEIERLTAQQTQLQNQVALATLTVTFGTEVVAVTQAAARWDPAAEVDRASATLISVVQGLISVLIVLAIVWLPILVAVGLLVLIGIAIARRLGWTASRPGGPPAMPPEPPVTPTAAEA
jgi:hypothetical protein